MNPYKELANAIIVQAVKDYRTALNQLSLNPNDKVAQSEKRVLNAFSFRFFSILTDLNGEVILAKLKEVSV